MASEDQDQKTEQPTGKRLDEAREHGQIPVSREAATWVSLLGILIVTGWVVPSFIAELAGFLRGLLENAGSFDMNENNTQALFAEVGIKLAYVLGIPFFLLMAAGIFGVMMQTGFFFALDLLQPDLSRLLPSRGLRRLFSSQALVDFAKSFGKVVFLGLIVFAVLTPIGFAAPGFTGMAFANILGFVHEKIIHLIEMMLLAFTLIAAGDLFYTRFEYTRNLRMTKTEVKDEMKQQEGDPMIKSRLRQLRMEKARKRMMAQVPKADVVITNPTHYAVALHYDNNKMLAPVVVAKGINLIAERIRDIADQNRIPLVSNPPLARALYDTVEIDHAIPTQHYRAVAEVISYVYKIKKRMF